MRIAAIAVAMCLILSTILFVPVSIKEVGGQESRVIHVLNAQTGENLTTVGNDADPMPEGELPFTVNVTLAGTTDFLFNYQIALKYDRTSVRCTAAWINRDDPTFVFYQIRNEVTIPPEPEIRDDIGYVTYGASASMQDIYVNVSSGLMLQANFTAFRKGTSVVGIIPTNDPEYQLYADSYLWDIDTHYIAFTKDDLLLAAKCGVSDPRPSFTFQPENPMEGENVTFDASGSYDPYGNITLYSWNFSDGATANTSAPTTIHSFTHNAPYLVTLTANNENNLSRSFTHEVQVGLIPNAYFTYDPSQVREDVTINFDAGGSSDSDGSIVNFAWNFGDGSQDSTSSNSTIHIFLAKGVFTVNLTVYDNDGLHNSTAQVLAVGELPTVNFIFSPVNPEFDEVVTYNASLSHAANSADSLVLYIWDFGDYNVTTVNASTTATPAITQHVYVGEGQGIYPVNLTVYDNNGLYNSMVQNITVGSAVQPPDLTLYIIIGIVIASAVIIGAILLLKRPKRKRHTPKPEKR